MGSAVGCARAFRSLLPGVLGIVLAAILFGGTAAAATDDTLTFAILRDGDRIGTHVVKFRREGDRLDVSIDTRIAVEVAWIVVYRWEQTRSETWRDGSLVSFETRTNDNGEESSASGRRVGDLFRIRTKSGEEVEAPPDIMPNSWWNAAVVDAGRLLNAATGRVSELKVRLLGEEEIEVRGERRKARRYEMTASKKREVWYDGAGTWVRLRLVARDDSVIEYVLE